MSTKKCLISTFAIFVTVEITDFLIHGVILKSLYAATPQLWRAPEEMHTTYMPFMLTGQFLVAVFFAWIFAHGYKGKGIIEGIRFGLLIGGLEAGRALVMHAVEPYELSLTLSWIFFGILQGMIIGIVASLVWGKDKLK